MKTILPSIHTIKVPPVRGVPFPDENFEPVGVNDPQELRDRLGAQNVARSVLPFIDSREAHWRYYLFAVPTSGRGRPINVKRRLLSVLDQTESRAGIGRPEYRRFVSDNRRSANRFLERLYRGFANAYGSATTAFWGLRPTDGSRESPSDALCDVSRQYILAGNYANFFAYNELPDRLRHMFRSRLIRLRPSIAKHIIRYEYALDKAAIGAASSRKLDDSDRLLFFSWALLQAYFGIADDGRLDNAKKEDDEEPSQLEAGDDYFRGLAKASLDLLEYLGAPGELNDKQVDLIRARLKTALRHKGPYQPPVIVWKLKNDGHRRRVFTSLRLFAYARLLRTTKGPS